MGSRLLAGLLGILIAGAVQADTLLLDNGDRISGTLIRLGDGRVEFRQQVTSTTVNINWDRVAGLTTDDVVRVLLNDGTEIAGRIVEAEDGRLRMDSVNLDAPVSFALTSVAEISGPSTPERDRVRTTGNIAAGGNFTRGNTRSEAYNANGNFEARTNVNRFRLAGDVNQAKDDGVLVRDNASATARYDHFLSDRVYANSSVSLNRNRFKDLRLRTAAGAGFGYQFFDSPRRSLSSELGVSYVNQDFYDAENESNPAGRWAIDYEERLFGASLRLFHSQEGLVSLEKAGEFLVQTRTGLRFPLMFGLTGTLQANVDYDNDPPGDRRKTDQAYVATIGYSW
ncbi:putative salt-induced outer membrane protein YdiY [Natronocella acetinitrilica]|uniref:Salt-induced outer membrane protein YdiY n=1 Tax=Natronocella acetinitrilica TaxID=414046 RepID=A0AAE3G361_9GAMM|nr:DUF481 domain-containing protein [Natronocella acetinitrilica]MCP1674965.1 putative salt-induced outer membrane protein YdiY [Natronocella acetinitrilica]